ncbi:MAG TPA: transglycosylase SLT domain-containing protein [Terracidiphilus sp.]|nr:transglycosylase SLT domain-containing protein [Terracidiphilus sp.]
MVFLRYRWFAPAALALFLTGCPQQGAKAPSATPPTQATAPATPAPAPAAPVQQGPTQEALRQQQIQKLIERVNAAYAAGDADYRRGQLVDAKVQFDHAVDLMLTSGIDIKSEPALEDEFNRIIDQVNALEMEALKVGNGFAPKEEETPAEVASDVTFAANPDIEAKAQAELATTHSDLPLMVNEYVSSFINFFANSQRGHNTLLHSFERAGRYKAMIQRVMAEEGVPQDLIYLAVAESGFQPRAVNRRSGAGGMWQFMPHGQYGLERNGYVDERFDPEKSTRSYARYMKFLYDQLGDWYLAMAAYDWGAGNIQRAVEKTGYADFWELYKRHNLPGETQNYVPEILAAIIIANNPHQYGFDDITLDPPVLTDTVTLNYSVDLRLVSDLVGAPVDELEALNPSLLRMVTPPDAPFDLHLPAGTATMFDEKIAAIPESHRNSWRYHRVAAEDTLESVAQTYHVSKSDLAAANQLSEGESLAGIEALVVPVPPAAAPSAHTVMYTARRGDTLVSIADRFGLSLDQLRRWNHLTAGDKRVTPGQRLHVAEPAAPRRRGRHARTTITAADLHPKSGGAKGTSHKGKKHASSSHTATASAKQK